MNNKKENLIKEAVNALEDLRKYEMERSIVLNSVIKIISEILENEIHES